MAYVYKYAAFPQGRGNFEMYLAYEITQNQAANTSTIEVHFGLHTLTIYASETWNTNGATSCLIAGQGVTGQGYDLRGTQADNLVELLTTRQTITHNADGTHAPVALYGSCNCSGTGQGQGEISVSAALPTIPRASSIVTSANVVPGAAYSVTISSPSPSFTHILSLLSGSTVVAEKALGVGVTTVSFTAAETANLYALYPNVNEANVTLRLLNSLALTSTKTVRMVINPTLAAPTFTTYSHQDTNSVSVAASGSNQKIVSGISNLQISISTAQKAISNTHATIVKYIATVGTKRAEAAYSASTAVNISINAVDSGSMQVVAVDSRGNQTVVSKSATFIPYTRPVIQATAPRQDGIGEEVSLIGTVNIYTSNITNSVRQITYRYRAGGSGTWHQGQTAITPGTSFNTVILGDIATGFTANSNFMLEITAYDALTSSTRTVEISSGMPVIGLYRYANDVRVRIGGKADPNGAQFQVDDMSFQGYKVATTIKYQGSSGTRYWVQFNDGTFILWATGLISVAQSAWQVLGSGYYVNDLAVITLPFVPTRIDSISVVPGSTASHVMVSATTYDSGNRYVKCALNSFYRPTITNGSFYVTVCGIA